MAKSFRGRILIIVACFAFISSALSILSLFLNIYELLELNDFKFSSLPIDTTIGSGIDILFAIIGISFGAKLIKAINNNDYFESYKMSSGLVTTIIVAIFTQFIFNLVLAFVLSKPIQDLDIIFLILFFISCTISSFIRPMILRRKLKELDLIMFISSLLTLFIFIIDYKSYFVFSKETLLGTLSNTIDFILILLLTIFSLVSFIYYVKNPEACAVEERDHEDIDIIETYETYEVVKLYSFRGVDNEKTTISKKISIVACIIGIIFSILFFIENKFHVNLKEHINSFIDLFSLSSSGDIYDVLFYLIKFIIPIIVFTNSLNYLFGILTNNARYKIDNIYIIQSGTMFLSITLYARIISLALSYYNLTFSFSMLNIVDILLVVAYIGNSIAKKTFKQVLKELNEGIANGDTYNKHLSKMVPMNITYGIISILSTIIFAYSDFVSSNTFKFSLILLVITILLVIIGCYKEKKNPPSEYVVIKRKR